MSQDLLRQVLITSFPGAHEADHYATARFHESNTWLSLALCHCSNEHVICLEFRQSIRRLGHHNSSVRRTSSRTRNTDRAQSLDSIRQTDVQVGMTIVGYQIHCLVSKDDTVIIMIEDDCDATMVQCRSAQERFAQVHHVKCDLDQNSSTAVCHHMSVNHFLSAELQCHVVRCHSFNVCRAHHWRLRCKPKWANMCKTSRIDHQLVLLSFPSRLISPIHRVPTFLAIFQREYPESLICASNINLAAVRTCLMSKFLRLVYCCHFH